jgi:hypothetical protein
MGGLTLSLKLFGKLVELEIQMETTNTLYYNLYVSHPIVLDTIINDRRNETNRTSACIILIYRVYLRSDDMFRPSSLCHHH